MRPPLRCEAQVPRGGSLPRGTGFVRIDLARRVGAIELRGPIYCRYG
jgi:hypothetical protein